MLKICDDELPETKMGMETRFEVSKICIIYIVYLFVNGKFVNSMQKKNILLYNIIIVYCTYLLFYGIGIR